MNPKEKTLDIILEKNDAEVEISPGMCAQACKRIGLEYHEGLEKRIIQFRLTDQTVDRHNEVVIAKGVNLAGFKKDPIILFQHDRWSMPIGKSIKTWYEKGEEAIFGQLLFFDDEIDRTGMSEDVYRMVKAGAMKSGSIGFSASWDDVRKPSPEEITQYGFKNKNGYIIDKSELREFSIVTIPANPNAVQAPTKMEIRGKTLEALLAEGVDLMKMEQGEKYFVKSAESVPAEKPEAVIEKPDSKSEGPIFTLDEGEKEIHVHIRIEEGDTFKEIEKKMEWAKQLTETKAANTVKVELSATGQPTQDFTKDLEEIKQALSDLRQLVAAKDEAEEPEEDPVQKDDSGESDSALYEILEKGNKLLNNEE